MERYGKFVFILLVCSSLLCMCTGENGNTDESYKETAVQKFFHPEIDFKGKIIFQSDFDGDNEIYMISMKGMKKLTDNAWQDEYPVWSPDGKKIAFSANPDGNYDIFTMNADGSDIQQITTSSRNEITPAWFPDNETIAYTMNMGGAFRNKDFLFKIDIYSKRTQRIIQDYNRKHIVPWVSPDASLLTFTGKRTMGWDVALYDLKTKQATFLEESGKSCRGRFSPDGKKIAYVCSLADGKGDVWIMNPDGSQKNRLTKRDDTYDYFPSWSPDGKFIVFNSSLKHDHIGKLFIVEVKTGKVFFLFDSPGNDVYPAWN